MKDREHYRRVAELGCIICRAPAEIHHLTGPQHRGMGQKADFTKTIPLCHRHHRTGGPGVAIHAGKKTWEALHGTEEELLLKALAELGIRLIVRSNSG
jgi:hypothetical protein